jgi:hypothetical protein
MSNNLPASKDKVMQFITSLQHDWMILIVLLGLSVIGVAITDATERLSHWYWLLMVPVFFSACLYLELKTTYVREIPYRQQVIRQVLHWASLLVGISIALLLRDIGSIDNQATGLILLLLFAMTTFQAGINMGWLFRLLGVMLVVSLIFVAFAEHYIWLVIICSLLVMMIYGFVIKRTHAD